MRYRRDVPRGTDLVEVSRHIVAHLAGAVTAASGDPGEAAEDVRVNVYEHIDGDPEMVTVIGEIPSEPDAPYLRPDFNPDADHPEIAFRPYEEPELGRFADHEALGRFLRGEGW